MHFLVLYTFSTNDLEEYTFEEIISIVEYVSHNQNSLCCEALEAEATAKNQLSNEG